MLHQKDISFAYGVLVFTLCFAVLVGMKFMINTLIALILTSIVFFHVDFQIGLEKPVNMESVKTISLLMVIVGALFIMKGGYSTKQVQSV